MSSTRLARRIDAGTVGLTALWTFDWTVDLDVLWPFDWTFDRKLDRTFD